MRHTIALLVTSWIIGILCGALSAPYFFILALVLLVNIWALVIQRKPQVIVGVSSLLLLGYLYGLQSDGVSAAQCSPSDVSTARLHATSALTPTGARYVFVREDGCKLLVYASRFPVLVRGTEAEIRGKQTTPLEEFKSLPEYAHFLLDDGISLIVRNGEVTVTKKGIGGIDEFRVGISSRIMKLFREPDASLVVAMIVGDQGMIPQSVKYVYRKSGITHILSISGLHISVIAVVLTLCVSMLRLSPSIRSALILGLLWIYVIGVGSPASAVRAAVFWTCYVLAYHMRALMGLLTVVLLTLAILLTVSPELVRSIGFELSVLAVCGIGAALFFLRNVRMTPGIKNVITLLAVSAGATIATAPLTLFYFGNLSLVGLITNLLVVPLLPFITYLVLLALFLQPLFAPLALVCSFVVHILLQWILFISTLCASIPYGNFEGISFPLWGVAVYYGILVAVIIFLMKYLRISWREWWV
jgi:ComEC/Rec2-related protein